MLNAKLHNKYGVKNPKDNSWLLGGVVDVVKHTMHKKMYMDVVTYCIYIKQ
jgi:hypothetical protein